MSLQAPPRWPDSGIKPFRFTVEMCEQMMQAGFFQDTPHFELIDGRFVERMTKSDSHDYCIDVLASLLEALLRPDCFVRQEKSLSMGRYSRPEPELYVVRGRRQDFQGGGPKVADVPLIVEVADWSYPKDRSKMWRLYAEARVPVYWIVRLHERCVEVSDGPEGRGKTAAYRHTATFGEGAEVPVTIGGVERGRLAIASFLPRDPKPGPDGA
jgi:Uma2 family endonuclease